MTPSNSGRTDPPAGRQPRRGPAAGTGRATGSRSGARRTGRDGQAPGRGEGPAVAGEAAGEATGHATGGPAGGTATAAWLEPRRLVPDLVIALWLLLIALLDADGPFRAAVETLRRLVESR